MQQGSPAVSLMPETTANAEPETTCVAEVTPMPTSQSIDYLPNDDGINITNLSGPSSNPSDGNRSIPQLNKYDALNRLIEVKMGDKIYRYGYNEEGLRVWKEVDGVKTYYVWDGDQIVLELNANGNVKKKHIRGSALICSEDDNSSTDDKVYYNVDGHGNVVQLIDQSGNVSRYYQYDAFGNEINEDENDENPWRYCSEYYDKETQTVYLRARYYDAGYGRFTQEDPVKDGDNWYVYCSNDPLNMIDPTGLWGKSTHTSMTDNALIKKRLDNKYKKIIKKGSYLPDVWFTGWHTLYWQWHSRKQMTKSTSSKLVVTNKNKTLKAFTFNTFQKQIRNKAKKLINGKKPKVGDKYLSTSSYAIIKKAYTDRKEQGYCLLGLGLHSVQDSYSHFVYNGPTYQHHIYESGKEGGKVRTDNPAYDIYKYDKKGNGGAMYYAKKISGGSQRAKLAESKTKDYLKVIK